MSVKSLAVLATIGPRRANNIPKVASALKCQSTDNFRVYWLCETPALNILCREQKRPQDVVATIPTPINNGHYSVVPYALKINWAFDHLEEPYVTYLTDDSYPQPFKYETMIEGLAEHPVVYVGQRRNDTDRPTIGPVGDAYCVLDHTQVAHRYDKSLRWREDIQVITLGDAYFWRDLHALWGDFQPVGDGILDVTEQDEYGITRKRTEI